MWSCRLSKIKSSNLKGSIANSTALTEVKAMQSTPSEAFHRAYFFTKIGHWQHLIELFIASLVLAIVLALAEAQSWSALNWLNVVQYVLFIHWVLLCFAAIVEKTQSVLHRLGSVSLFFLGFALLQMIVLMTTILLNVVLYWGKFFSLSHISMIQIFEHVPLNLSYGVLLGAFCLRYLYLREQWMKQQNSELQARIQAMQARIHPHFLFNSLNSVVSLISIDPDKAENMLINLSRLFRASFQELKLVSLQEEIQLSKQYLAIEQVRVGERLKIEWKIVNPEYLSDVKIPLLTLQPLLENSIFHGVESSLSGSTISVLVEILQKQVNIVITNPYTTDKIKRRQGHGIAIDNVKERLKGYFGSSVQFQTYAGNGIFTTVIQYRYK